MLLVIPFAALVGAALALATALKKPFELTLLPTIACSILILFIAGLVGALPAARMGMIAAGLMTFIWVAVRHTNSLKALLHPGPIICGTLLLVLAALKQNSILVVWDEFSHWGRIVRYMTITDAFPNQTSPVLFPDYPYGSALFEYAMAIGNGLTESSWVFAANVLKVSGLLTLFSGLRWRDAMFLPAITVFVVLSPSVLPVVAADWGNLLIDFPLAVMTAGVIVIYLRGGADTRSTALIVPIVAALPLIKDIGLAFAMVSIVLIACDQCLLALKDRRLPWGSLAITAGAFASVIVSRALWLWHLKNIHAQSTFILSTAQINVRLHHPEFGTVLAGVADKLYEAIATVQIGSTAITITQWVGLMLLLAFAGTIVSNDRWRAISVGSMHMLLALAFVLYVVFLLFLYLFSFGAYEAVRLAGFHRYASTFLMLWTVVALALLIAPHTSSSWKQFASAAALTTFVALIAYRPAITLRHHFSLQSNSERAERQLVKSALGDYQVRVPINSKVYSLWNDSTGLQFYTTLYELTPRSGNGACFSVGPKRYEGDVWTCDVSPDHFIDAFLHGDKVIGSITDRAASSEERAYDFLFIGSADEPFWDRFDPMFAPDARRSGAHWFALEPDGYGKQLFRPLP